MNLNDKLEYALSDADIKNQLPPSGVRLIEYPQLKNYNSITELLPNKKDAVIILVQIKNKHNGHIYLILWRTVLIKIYCGHLSI